MSTGQVPGGYAYVTATWNAPSGEVVQAYWKIDGMGHAWSGGNPAGSYTDPRGPDATKAMYHFSMAHPLKSIEIERPLSHARLRHILTSIFMRIQRVHRQVDSRDHRSDLRPDLSAIGGLEEE